MVEKPQASSNASEGNSAKSIGQHPLAEAPRILPPPLQATPLQDSGRTTEITRNRRGPRAGPRRSYSVLDYTSTLSCIGAVPWKMTLDCLPPEIHVAMFDYLDLIDSTCLGLTNKHFYAIHRRIHGTVPLTTRRGGRNHVEKAWEMAALSMSPTPGRGLFDISISPVLGAISMLSSLMIAVQLGQRYRAMSQPNQSFDVQFFCPKCGFRRCELHKHLSEWMGSHSEYCAVREKFVSPAEKVGVAALCSSRYDLRGKVYCARHRMRGCKLLDAVDSQQTPGSSDSNPRQCHRPQSPASDTQSQHSSVSPSQMSGSMGKQDSSSSSENDEDRYAISHSRKAMIIDRVMASFKVWLDSRLSLLTYHYHGTSAAGQQSSSHSGAPEGSHGNETRPQKRRSGEGQDDSSGESPDENGDGGKGGEQARKKTRLDWQQKRKFACPFYKHNRRAYQSWRVCSGPG